MGKLTLQSSLIFIPFPSFPSVHEAFKVQDFDMNIFLLFFIYFSFSFLSLIVYTTIYLLLKKKKVSKF